jgi:hypothetical protein
MQMGTASAGPLAINERRLTALMTRIMTAGDKPEVIH